MNFNSAYRSRPFISNWFTLRTRFPGALPLDASIAGTLDHLCQHVGLKPVGGYTLFAVDSSRVVWIPAAWDGREAKYRSEVLELIESGAYSPPFHPWSVKHDPKPPQGHNYRYMSWYYRAKANAFDCFADFIEAVGDRPANKWTLTHMQPIHRRKGEPLSAENFLWLSPESVEALAAGEVVYPEFPPGTRTGAQQQINNTRFQFYIADKIKRIQKQQQIDAEKAKIEADYQRVITAMTEFVVSKGFPASAVLDPAVLPDNQKLKAGRALAHKLMDEYTMTPQRLSIRRLNEQRRARKQAAREARENARPNQVYSGSRGRPLKKTIKVKVKIASLTSEQRQAYGLHPTEDFYYIRTPKTGRLAKKTTIQIEIPNPKLQEQNATTPAQNNQYLAHTS